MSRNRRIPLVTALTVGCLPATGARAAEGQTLLDCGTVHPEQWAADLGAAVARGDVPDPRARPLPVLPPGQPQRAGGAACLTREHIFPFEDTNSVLLTNFSDVQLFLLLLDAVNALLATHGDNYDFAGFWLNFVPHHTIGTAFYVGVLNDVSGLGLDIFDNHAQFGLAGERLQGAVMMWNVNSSFWQPGDGPAADFTRLVLGQEFEHRWAMFLPGLLDGRVLQGDDVSCGRSAHWSRRVDGQGSGMEIPEWVGSNPAIRNGATLAFNADNGGVFSYTDLYLMGSVSPAEMDAGNSELRFMDDSTCSQTYFGPISDFSSADIIASAGERIPSSADSQQDFRTAWIMLHLPGAGPTDTELDKAVGILEQHVIDWQFSTLGRGTMDNSLFADCNCNGVPDGDDITGGKSRDVKGNGIPDECECPWDCGYSNGNVGIVDFLALLAQWNMVGAPCDFDGGGVGIVDFLALLANWGPCP